MTDKILLEILDKLTKVLELLEDKKVSKDSKDDNAKKVFMHVARKIKIKGRAQETEVCRNINLPASQVREILGELTKSKMLKYRLIENEIFYFLGDKA